jgi:DNA adenine methylase
MESYPIPLSDNEKICRAVLRYLGGKWRLAPWVIAHLPPHRIYVEPFGGAGSVLLRKPRSPVEVYNDLDEEIAGVFTVIQDPMQCQALMRRLRRVPYGRVAFEQSFCPSRNPVVRAQRAITRAYLSFHHGSLFDLRKRTFSDARHRTGHPKSHEWPSYPRTLPFVRRRLVGVVIERRDALDVIRAQDTPETLFYVDPPYVPSTRSDTSYRCELTEERHAELLDRLRAVKGMVVLSGYPSELYDRTLADWQRFEMLARAAGSSRIRREVLWLSPAAAMALSNCR